MGSEKNERLINLVIALLATKKYLTKNQIFRAVAGYEGSQEATDRMFERDKEELRSLGIQIEMKGIDPLFDDEIGYRIIPDRYRFDLGPLTKQEITLLALASQAWKESALSDLARSTYLRLESLGVSSDFTDLPLTPTIANVPENLPALLEAIDQRKFIEFKYFNQEDYLESRKVAPYGIYSLNQRWYLYAHDADREDLRSYRIDRIDGEIKRSSKSFDLPEFTLPDRHFPSIQALVEIQRDLAPELLSKLEILNETDDWIRGTVEFKSENEAISQILKSSPNVRVIEPVSLVKSVTQALSEMVALYAD